MNQELLEAGLIDTGRQAVRNRFRALGVLALILGAISAAALAVFVERLEAFFQSAPGGFQYAVEIRNRELLVPAYLELSRAQADELGQVDRAILSLRAADNKEVDAVSERGKRMLAHMGVFESISITPCASRCTTLPWRATTVTVPAISPRSM